MQDNDSSRKQGQAEDWPSQFIDVPRTYEGKEVEQKKSAKMDEKQGRVICNKEDNK